MGPLEAAIAARWQRELGELGIKAEPVLDDAGTLTALALVSLSAPPGAATKDVPADQVPGFISFAQTWAAIFRAKGEL